METVLEPLAATQPGEQEMIDRARGLVPFFRSLDAKAEQLGRAPDEAVDALRTAGFFRMLQPKAYGGYEMSPQTALDVIRILANASPGIAWVAALLIVHNWEIALVDPQVAEDIWGNNPDALISSSYAPFGKAEPVEGGYIVNGSWAWSSGCDPCEWVVLGVMLPADNRWGVLQKVMIIPRSDYTIDQDSWQMAGMQGSGSKTVIVKDAFVPEYRVHDVMESFAGRNPGTATFTSPIYKAPFGALFAWTLGTLCIGMAQGALDLYVDYMRKRNHAYSGQPMAKDPFTLQKVGEAAAMINAAYAVHVKDLAEITRLVSTEGAIPHSARIAYKNNAAFAGRMACDALTKVIKAAGGSAFARANQLQRMFRDIHCGSNHAFINPDRGAYNYGLFLMSGEIDDFVI